MMRFVLRHGYLDFVVVYGVAIGGQLLIGTQTASDTPGLLWFMTWLIVSAFPLRYLNGRRRREWRELGIPEPAPLAFEMFFNAYPLTPAARRRRRIYLAVFIATAAIVAALALLETSAWAGVAATLVMAAGALAALVVFARAYRAGD